MVIGRSKLSDDLRSKTNTRPIEAREMKKVGGKYYWMAQCLVSVKLALWKSILWRFFPRPTVVLLDEALVGPTEG